MAPAPHEASTLVVVQADELALIVREAVAEALAQQRPADDSDRLLTVTEAADLISLSENALRLAIAKGKLDSAVVRLGRSVRLKRGALLAIWQAGA